MHYWFAACFVQIEWVSQILCVHCILYLLFNFICENGNVKPISYFQCQLEAAFQRLIEEMAGT